MSLVQVIAPFRTIPNTSASPRYWIWKQKRYKDKKIWWKVNPISAEWLVLLQLQSEACCGSCSAWRRSGARGRPPTPPTPSRPMTSRRPSRWDASGGSWFPIWRNLVWCGSMVMEVAAMVAMAVRRVKSWFRIWDGTCRPWLKDEPRLSELLFLCRKMWSNGCLHQLPHWTLGWVCVLQLLLNVLASLRLKRRSRTFWLWSQHHICIAVIDGLAMQISESDFCCHLLWCFKPSWRRLLRQMENKVKLINLQKSCLSNSLWWNQRKLRIPKLSCRVGFKVVWQDMTVAGVKPRGSWPQQALQENYAADWDEL